MEFINALVETLTNFELLTLVLLASIVGIIIGSIPGLTISAAMAIILPLTYFMDPLFAISLLYVMGKAGRYGGSISAILFNTPGTTASTITQIDGYPMAQKGQAEKALKISAVSSMCGDLIGDVLLLLCIGVLSAFALQLGPPEVFSIYLTTFILLAFVINKHPLKGFVCILLGMLTSTIGIDPISGQERLDFDVFELLNGITLIPLMIGMFVMSEVIDRAVMQVDSTQSNSQQQAQSKNLAYSDIKRCFSPILSGGFIGAIVGLLPGIGSAVAAYLSYLFSKSRSNTPECWGKGEIQGVASAESANNAVSGPSMIPLLTLGIPGSTMGTVLLSALIIHGVNVGPTLMIGSQDFILQIFICGIIGIICYGLIGFFAAKHIAAMVDNLPQQLIYPAIFILCFISAYSISGSNFDVLIMIIAGIAGWLMKRFQFSPPIFIIAFILTKGAEESLIQTKLLSTFGLDILLERPIALGFLSFSGFILLFRFALLLRKSKHNTVF